MNAVALPDWRRAWGGPPVRAQVRSTPEDFQVVERLGFELTGDGEHDFLWIEKTAANTTWVARGLARFAGVAVQDVGYAGLKDRAAVACQWFSVRRPSAAGTDWDNLDIPGVRLIASSRNQRKLKTGAHSGNEFRIALRGINTIDESLLSVLVQCRDGGVPNYFGEQRFGRNGGNIDMARAFFSGKRLKRDDRSMAISAARSLIFNRMLECRVSDGSWNCVEAGDIVNLDGSGSVFAVDDADDALHARCSALDIHPSAALWGKGQSSSGRRIHLLEIEVANEFPDLAAGLERHAEQSRRALRLAVRNMRWTLNKDVLWLEFFLMRGGFATAVLREIAAY